jgi:hypothetical protein
MSIRIGPHFAFEVAAPAVAGTRAEIAAAVASNAAMRLIRIPLR